MKLPFREFHFWRSNPTHTKDQKVTEFNKLKSVSVNDMQKAIAKALSELTGTEYECSIANISYELLEGGKFEVSVHKPLDFTSSKKKSRPFSEA